MTALQLVRTLHRLQAEHGPGAAVHRLPLGVLESDAKRRSEAAAINREGVAPSGERADEPVEVNAAPTLLELPRDICGERAGYAFHVCSLKPGHDGNCRCHCSHWFDPSESF